MTIYVGQLNERSKYHVIDREGTGVLCGAREFIAKDDPDLLPPGASWYEGIDMEDPNLCPECKRKMNLGTPIAVLGWNHLLENLKGDR
jgi:hypothetical protein